jgi:DNA-binding IclR family transcriptional regulator
MSMSTIKRTLEILERIVDAPSPPSHGELARALKIPKSTLSQILAELITTGYVRSRERRYLPGPRLTAIGYRATRTSSIQTAIKPLLDRLSQESGETAICSMAMTDCFMFIEQSVSSQSVRYSITVGDTRPLYCTAMGRVFLAYDSRLVAELPRRLRALTPRTVTDRGELNQVLDEVRVKGYALNDGESAAEVSAIAMPILDQERHAIAAVSITGPSGRMNPLPGKYIDILRRGIDQFVL